MKKINLLLLFAAFVLFESCKKDPENQVFVTEENIATYVAGNLAADTRGLLTTLEAAAHWSARGIADAAPCNYVKDSTFSENNTTGSPSFSFAKSYHTDIQCLDNAPNVVHFSHTHNGLWETAAAKGSGNGNGAWNITDLAPLATAYKVSGDYSRSGTGVDKKKDNLTFSTDFRAKLVNIAIDKTNNMLVGGSLTFTLSGASSSGEDYEYTGNIAILSPNSAQMTINNKTYTINLTTGAVE